MMLFRCAQDSDLDALHDLAQFSTAGMTTLPKNMIMLKKRLNHSNQSFKKKVTQPKDEYYLFVLEDQSNQKVVGMSAIEAQTGYLIPFYSFKLSKHTQMSHELKIRNDYEVLTLVNDNQEYTEICTLFLNPEYRHKHNGLLLSKGRFLFMAQSPKRFSRTIIAELRGISDEHGMSPFWEHLGRHFFKMTYPEADDLILATNNQFIEDLMPRNPIYVPLLNPEAQAVIGKPNHSTIPALHMLLKEGFHYTHYIHIFDGGPTIEAPLDQIKTIAASRTMVIKSISDEVSGSDYLISNTSMNFRATVHSALNHDEENCCIISKDVAELLKVKLGDQVRLSPARIHEGL